MYLTDLAFIEEGTPNFTEEGLVNFSKMRMVGGHFCDWPVSVTSWLSKKRLDNEGGVSF